MHRVRKLNTFILLGTPILLFLIRAIPLNKNHKATNYLPDLSFVTPLPNAHAHNDYEHSFPLIEALSHGFTSIEVDVHLINGHLFVNHLRPFFPNPERTIQKLYLDPLFQKFQNDPNNFLFNDQTPLTLMVDIKSNSEQTYECLKNILSAYEPMLTSWKNNQERPGAVKILLSGNRPIETALSEQIRWVQIDGRIEDIGKNFHPEFMPIISDKYSKVLGKQLFSKRLSSKKLVKLKSIAEQTHAEGKKLRLWKSPEDELIWSQLLSQGVDIINTDSLILLSRFLNHSDSSAKSYVSK